MSQLKPGPTKRRATGLSGRSGPKLFELEQDDLGLRAYAEGRSPGSGTARGVDQHLADAIEAVDELAVDSGRDPVVRDHLAKMGVTGDLKADAGGFGDGDVVGRMGEQDAGAVAVDTDFVENRAEVLRVGGVFIWDADDL
jgi:hypothetical protein